MVNKFPQNRDELLKEIKDLVETACVTEDKIMLLSLGYLINELVPKRRKTKEVFKK